MQSFTFRIDASAQNGDAFNDAVYNRIRAVENRLNLKIGGKLYSAPCEISANVYDRFRTGFFNKKLAEELKVESTEMLDIMFSNVQCGLHGKYKIKSIIT